MAYSKRYPARATTTTDTSAPAKKKWNGYKKPAPIVRIPHVPICNPSAQQVAIWDDMANGMGNTVILARAGTGKTTTYIEGLYRMSPTRSVMVFSFNTRIAAEATSKVPVWVNVKTCHAFGLMCLKSAWGHVEVDKDKDWNIATAIVGNAPEKTELCFNVSKAMSLAKSYLADTSSAIEEVCDKHGIELCGEKKEDFIAHVLKALDMSAWVEHINPATGEKYKQVNKRISFDDMIWLVIKHNISTPKYDDIIVDEAQDLNRARLELTLRARKDTSRYFAVGDDMQAIYGFCGADKDAIGYIIERTSAKTLPLTTTYRCGKSIVALAQAVVPDYNAAPTAPDGEVVDVSETYMLQNAQPGDFILSRTNAPLVPLCLQFLKEGRKANIQGRDMGKSLSYMIKRSGAESVDGFLTWLGNWKETECARLAAKNRDTGPTADKAEVLEALCEGAAQLSDVRANISRLFDDIENDMARIMLSTVHKAKGLERERVYMLTSTFKADKGAEEANIWYVAVTRAKSLLHLVSGKGATKDVSRSENEHFIESQQE